LTIINPTGRRVYFLSPHADDDCLSMGQVAWYHARVGRRVSFILGAPGRTTTAIDSINGLTANSWWGGTHDLAREGYATLTPDDIVASRDAEFMDSAALLGAVPGEIHLNTALRHDSPTIDQAKAVLQYFHDLDPAAGMYTMHWQDVDPTHSMYGLALKQLREANPAAWPDVRWLVRESQALSGEIPCDQYVIPAQYAEETKIAVRQSARAYSCWAPLQGRFAVGYHSVGTSLFPSVASGNPNWIVHP